MPSSCAPGQHRCLPRSPRHATRPGAAAGAPSWALRVPEDEASALLLSGQGPTVRSPLFQESCLSDTDSQAASGRHGGVTKAGISTPSCSPSANATATQEDGAAVPTERVAQEPFVRVARLPGQRVRQFMLLLPLSEGSKPCPLPGLENHTRFQVQRRPHARLTKSGHFHGSKSVTRSNYTWSPSPW